MFSIGVFFSTGYNVFEASRSGDEPRPSLDKYKQNFKLITFSIFDKSRATPFLETAVLVAQHNKYIKKDFQKNK